MPAQTFYTGVNVADRRDTRHFMHYTNENETKHDSNSMTMWQKEPNANHAFNRLKIRPLSGWKNESLHLLERLSSYESRRATSLTPSPPSLHAIHSCSPSSESSTAVATRVERASNQESRGTNNLHCASIRLQQCKPSHSPLPRNSQMQSRLVHLLLSPSCQLECVANQWNVFYTRHLNLIELEMSEEEEDLSEEKKQRASLRIIESDSARSSTNKCNNKDDDKNGICILYILPSQEYKNNHKIATNDNLVNVNSGNHTNTNNCNSNIRENELNKPTESNCTLSTVYELYCALAEAGVCALPTYSLLDVCQLRWKELLSCPSLRLQLRLMHNAQARSLLHMTEADQNTPVQIAVLHTSVSFLNSSTPIYRPMQNSTTQLCKLSSPRLFLSSEETIKCHSYNKYSNYHNTDAHLFQCLYVILMMYTIYDIRFTRHTIKHLSSSPSSLSSSSERCATNERHKTENRLSTAHSRRQTNKLDACHFAKQENETFVAFEHPAETNRWLCFPRTNPFSLSIDQLIIFSTETCVVAQTEKHKKHENEQKCINSVVQREGTGHSISLLELSQCVLHDPEIFAHVSTDFNTITEWAATQYIGNVHDAENALIALFDLFSHKYACSRAQLWQLSRTHKVQIYRCKGHVVRTRLHHLCKKKNGLNDNYVSVVECCIRQASTPLEREVQQLYVCAFTKENFDFKENDNDDDDEHTIDNANNKHIVHLSESQRHHEMTSFSVLPDHMLLTHEIQLQKQHHEQLIMEAHVEVLENKEDDVVDSNVIDEEPIEDHYVVNEEEYIVSPTSPYTHHESLVSRWRQYIRDEDYTVFAHSHENIELEKCIGVGGSGIVYRGRYGARRLLVAVKIFVRIDGVSEEDYIRQSLTDVAFYVLFNQLDDYGICHTCRAHDFIISEVMPTGITLEDATKARLGRNDESVQLCYLVTDLMEGTLGRFLTTGDDDYDEFYDTLRNSPLSAGELFQFLYTQLVIRCIFDWVILDVMLHGQLRGDNMGYQYIHPHFTLTSYIADNNNDSNKNHTQTEMEYWNCVYDGIIVQYWFAEGDEVQYLYFPAQEKATNTWKVVNSDNNNIKAQFMRFIYFVDLGQGLQPSVNDLTKRHLIGETLVDSCLNEDGLGRYWPLNKLYCKYVETRSCCDSDKAILEQVCNYASEVQINDEQDVVHALQKLFDLYAEKYSMTHPPTREQLRTNLVLTWSPQIVNALREAYVYRNN